MSPSKDDVSAFAVYNSKKSKRKRNRKFKPRTQESEDMFTAEEEFVHEEVLNDCDEPCASSSCKIRDKKKRRKSSIPFTVTSEPPRTSGVEIIDIEENSDDVLLIENAAKGKKRKIVVLNPENEVEEEEIIFEDVTGRRTNGTQPKRKSTERMKERRETVCSDDSSVSPDLFIVEEDEDSEGDSYSGNSLVEGRKLFVWLINPVIPEDFFK
jgi:hypothetical protein